MIKTIIKENSYMDSIFLLTATREMTKIDGVTNSVVVMGSDMNKTVLEEFGGLTPEAQAAGPNDLIIALDMESDDCIAAAEERLAQLLEGSGKKSANKTEDTEYRTLGIAADDNPEANMVIISVPGEFAAAEAKTALYRDMNVFMFSDNVPVEDEVEMKTIARERDLLVMGPGCGTAVINGVSLGLMSEIRRGHVGIVGASGSGIHEIAMLTHRYGEGVSQAIGTGGRDLSKEVGGITMLQGIEYLSQDPETKVIVLVSKPPHPDTCKKIYASLPKNKPVVIFFLGGKPEEIRAAGAYAPETLEQAAQMAVALARGEKVEDKGCVEEIIEELRPMAAEERAKIAPSQKYMRGLFCGGTHSEEVVLMLGERVPNLHSNIKFGNVEKLVNRHVSLENSLVDMGDEEFTKGKPHPVMDPTILVDRMLQEARDPEVGVILFDLLFGHGVHKDPVGAIEEALKGIQEIQEKENRHICLIAALCGTDRDPQGIADQQRRLEAYGVKIMPSNAKAALLAGLIVS